MPDITQQYNQTFVEFNPQQQANLAIEQLRKLQIADGAFTALPTGRTVTLNLPQSWSWMN